MDTEFKLTFSLRCFPAFFNADTQGRWPTYLFIDYPSFLLQVPAGVAV